MKISDIFLILRKNLLLLTIFPMLLAVLVYFNTRNEEKEYSSSFLVYTGIASGTNLTTEEHPRIDHNAVNNAFDNLLTTLKARETIEEVGVRLLVSHLRIEKADPAIISEKNFVHLKEVLPDSIRAKVRNAKTQEDAMIMVYNYKYAAKNNPIKSLLNSDNEMYGINFITSKMTAKRKDLSDMMEITYTANDAAICQQTLEIFSDVFIRRYREIKRGEINSVVAYFTDQTNKSQSKLKQAEDRVKDFGVKHKIINFTEQTKTVSEAKQSLIDNIQRENMVLSSAEATVNNLQSKINMRQGLMETNDKVVAKRQQLANLNYKIANASLSKSSADDVTRMKAEAEDVKEEIKEIVNQLYKINNSAEGMPRADLMTQWLANVLAMDESKARLKIMESRLGDFDAQYNELAPLGATLSQLEREVNVAEKEYLEQLSALNINKQRQQNIEMSSNIKVVDKPFYPLQPKPSKRMVLIVGAFVAGFTLIFATLLVLSFFDNKIKTPIRAEQLTGLRIAGLMPVVKPKEKKFDLEYLESSLMEQAISAIAVEMKERNINSNPKMIMVSSAKAEEGKTWCAYKLASKISEIKGKVLFLYPLSVSQELTGLRGEHRLEDPLLEMKSYEVKKDFMNKENIAQLMGKQFDLTQFSYVIMEIPPLADHQLPIDLVKKMDMTLLVVRADRTWSDTDIHVTKLFAKASSFEPMVVLNRVSLDHLKSLFGSIPKRNSLKAASLDSLRGTKDKESKTVNA
jgi:succinoglycan biosynthesis transport protein ExoP